MHMWVDININMTGDEQELSRNGRQKRVAAKLQNALSSAPAHVKEKWGQITALGGNAGKNAHKKHFLMQWVSNPEWAEAYFQQDLRLDQTRCDKVKGVWITPGRLEVLLGKHDAALAQEEGWYLKRQTPGTSKVEFFYSEESITGAKTKVIAKSVKGGKDLAIQDGKDMMIAGLQEDWNTAMGCGRDDAVLENEFLTNLPAPILYEAGSSSGEHVTRALGVTAAASGKRPAAGVPAGPPSKKKKKLTKAEIEAEKEEKKLEAEMKKTENQQKKDKAIVASLQHLPCTCRLTAFHWPQPEKAIAKISENCVMPWMQHTFLQSGDEGSAASTSPLGRQSTSVCKQASSGLGALHLCVCFSNSVACPRL